jgi:methanethiol S-methyltransferase
MVTEPQQSSQSDVAAPAEADHRVSSTLALLYGISCYLVFLAATVYAVGFVENVGAPTALDGGQHSPTIVALVVDSGLLGLFAVQHSVMARARFKAWWTSIIPPAVERSTFVLLSSLVLLLLFWQWRPIDAVVWRVENAVGSTVLLALSLVGWGLVILSTFLINHFDLFGLRQVYLDWSRRPYTPLSFSVASLYRLVRHPMMLGFLIAFWAAPRMTVGHLLFAVATTGYILLAVRFLEERDLVESLGDPYIAYRRRVPMILPLSRFWSKGN